MKLGFSGTRHGMTQRQRNVFTNYIKRERPTILDHGGCIGGDAQAHAITRYVLRLACLVNVWPTDGEWCARIPESEGVVVHDPMPPLDRNRVIVNRVDVMFIAPLTAFEQIRSGTWATYRYARTVGRQVIVCTPEGELREVCDV